MERVKPCLFLYSIYYFYSLKLALEKQRGKDQRKQQKRRVAKNLKLAWLGATAI